MRGSPGPAQRLSISVPEVLRYCESAYREPCPQEFRPVRWIVKRQCPVPPFHRPGSGIREQETEVFRLHRYHPYVRPGTASTSRTRSASPARRRPGARSAIVARVGRMCCAGRTACRCQRRIADRQPLWTGVTDFRCREGHARRGSGSLKLGGELVVVADEQPLAECVVALDAISYACRPG